MAGRPRKEGIAGDDNSELKDAIRSHLMKNMEQMFKDIESLEPKDRVDRRLKLMEYVMPKVQAIRTEETKAQSASQAILNAVSEYEE